MKNLFLVICSTVSITVLAQKPYISKVWVADNGDGTYKNPVLHADYSDPGYRSGILTCQRSSPGCWITTQTGEKAI